jgi:hypothetical protein
MSKLLRSQIVLAAAVSLAGAMCFAQDGAATYKAKCAMCHGPTGTPSAGMAKAMGIKPVSDPSMSGSHCGSDRGHREERQRQDEARRRTDRCAGEVAAYFKALAAYFKTLKCGKQGSNRAASCLKAGPLDPPAGRPETAVAWRLI